MLKIFTSKIVLIDKNIEIDRDIRTNPMCANQLTAMCLKNLCINFFSNFVKFQTISNGYCGY